MSQLNLKPDPIILGVQAIIFLFNMLVVKKLMLEPYLVIRARRDSQTGGSQDAAQALQAEATALESKITERMRQAHREAAQIRDGIKKEAADRRAALLAKADTEAKAEQSRIETAVASNLREERSRQEQTVKDISDQFFAQLTHS
jgi:F0F1-type ATP synthase membrane subunit b/b'